MHRVSAVVEAVLGHAPGQEAPLMEAGLDSLGAVELRNSLSSAFGVDLPPTAMFDYPTIAALARFLETAAGGAASAGELQAELSEDLSIGSGALDWAEVGTGGLFWRTCMNIH